MTNTITEIPTSEGIIQITQELEEDGEIFQSSIGWKDRPIDGVEDVIFSMILDHHNWGDIDVTTPTYIQSIETALEAIAFV